MSNPTLEYLNAAVAVTAFLISKDLKTTVSNIRNYFKEFPNNFEKLFESEQEVAFLQFIIDKGLLDDLTDKVKDAINEEKDCITKAESGQEYDACERKAEKKVCNPLNYIRDRNEGDLPTDYLIEKWKSYGCIRY